jgi:hypothetical protein
MPGGRQRESSGAMGKVPPLVERQAFPLRALQEPKLL